MSVSLVGWQIPRLVSTLSRSLIGRMGIRSLLDLETDHLVPSGPFIKVKDEASMGVVIYYGNMLTHMGAVVRRMSKHQKANNYLDV